MIKEFGCIIVVCVYKYLVILHPPCKQQMCLLYVLKWKRIVNEHVHHHPLLNWVHYLPKLKEPLHLYQHTLTR